MNALAKDNPPEENSVDTATDLYNTTADTATDLYNTTADTATDLYNTTADTATDLYNTTVDTATDLYNTTVDTATDLYNTTVDTVTDLYNITADTATDLYSAAADTAIDLYNATVDEHTRNIQSIISSLKELYTQSPNENIAKSYAMALFNMSLTESSEQMIEIADNIQQLYGAYPSAAIAECLGRIKYNITNSGKYNATKLKKIANEIEQLYTQYHTDRLAEPLCKIWHSISITRAKDRTSYEDNVIHLCSKVSDPETNTAYANVLFNSKNEIENRSKLINDFLNGTQTLESLGYYFESIYYSPEHNAALRNFNLYSSYPAEAIGKKMNESLKTLENHPRYTDLKAELLATLYYSLEIKDQLIVHDIPSTIGHYTRIENLKFLATPPDQVSTLRMYNAAYMNDPSEGAILPRFLFDNNEQKLLDFHSLESSNIYLSCFTTAIDELPMWSMYGNNGEGCCMILSKNYFDYIPAGITDEIYISSGCPHGKNLLYRICYLSENKNCDVTLDEFPGDSPKLTDNVCSALCALKDHVNKVLSITINKSPLDKKAIKILTSLLSQITYLFKDQSYSHEHELRLIEHSENPDLDETSWIIPQLYLEVKKPLKYDKIILGPKVSQPNKVIPYLLYTKKIETIEPSKIKYR